MAYIGRGTDKISNIEKLDVITFDGSQSYTLQKNSVNFVPNSANSLQVSIDGVVQAGNFTVSGSTIDFGVAIPSTSTCDFIFHYGTGLITTPADGTVDAGSLSTDAINGQTAETTTASGDEFLMYDTSASALRKVTRTNLNAGAMVLLSEATADDDASIIFDSSIITDDFLTYKVIGHNLKFATDDKRSEFVLSTDNGSSYTTSGYFHASYGGSSNDPHSTATFRSSTNTTGFRTSGVRFNHGDATGETMNFEGTLHGFRDSTSWKFFNFISGFGSDLGYITINHGVFGLKTTTKINNIKYLASSGNITSGKISIYGIK